MIDFIYSNISTIIIGIVLAAIVGMVIAKMVRDKKEGKVLPAEGAVRGARLIAPVIQKSNFQL